MTIMHFENIGFVGLDDMIIRTRINNARISEREWNFPSNSSIGFFGDFGEPRSASNRVTECEYFINQFGQTVIPQFRFEYFGDNAPHIMCDDVQLVINNNNFITNCVSISVQLSGKINLCITNESGSDIVGVNCYSN